MKTFDAIFLLGLRLNDDGSPRDELVLRVQEAVKCLNEGLSERIVACGGHIPGTPTSEAAVMRRLLLERGVPDSAIIMEDQSLITTQNIENGIRMLGGAKGKRVLVVTSDYHMFRSILLCRYMGLKAKGRKVLLPRGPEHTREARMERVYTVDLIMGWQGGKRKRPKWADVCYRRLFRWPKDSPLPGTHSQPREEKAGRPGA